MTRSAQRQPPALRDAAIRAEFIDEPDLLFSDGRTHVDPKQGILRFGPKSLGTSGHPGRIKVGIIGTSETSEKAQEWLAAVSGGIRGDPQHPQFPGFRLDRGFRAELAFDSHWIEIITRAELDALALNSRRRLRFEQTADLLESKLEMICRKDDAPTYILYALPDEISSNTSSISYRENGMTIGRNLRRVLKARSMRFKVATQIVLANTFFDIGLIETNDPIPGDYPSEIAWDFYTGLYYKAGGYPWGPSELQPGSCYIGLSFHRSNDSTKMQSSLAQAFDEHGDGLVLRGPDFEWDHEKHGTRSPHLSHEAAYGLVRHALDRYIAELKQTPRRVIIHKTSSYWPDESRGMVEAISGTASEYVLMALAQQSGMRLITANKYPPLRGTAFSIGKLDYLYTVGYSSELEQFHGVHVPAPIQLSNHTIYDTSRKALLKEILALTKLNWNSSRMGGTLPITLGFAKQVGEILTEIPEGQTPLANYKYYM